MKLLDFTGRKVDPSLLMGSMKESKKEQDPNIKVRPLTAAPLARWHAGTLTRCPAGKHAGTPPAQIYRAYAPYVSVVLHTPQSTPKKGKPEQPPEPEPEPEKKEVWCNYTRIYI